MSRIKKVFNYYQDPGHGWVKVPFSLLVELKIVADISSCSYHRGDFVYLEEDCDAGLFFEKYQEKYGFKPTIKSSWTNRQSKIRNYYSFFGYGKAFN